MCIVSPLYLNVGPFSSRNDVSHRRCRQLHPSITLCVRAEFQYTTQLCCCRASKASKATFNYHTAFALNLNTCIIISSAMTASALYAAGSAAAAALHLEYSAASAQLNLILNLALRPKQPPSPLQSTQASTSTARKLCTAALAQHCSRARELETPHTHPHFAS